jgi:hypothetical protein
MNTDGAARYEFRAWGDRLTVVTDKLRSVSACHQVRESNETYFVSTTAVDVNPKVRADLLDIKVLVDVKAGFEQWTVKLKAGFPVDADLLRTELFPLLGQPPPTLERAAYTLAQLVRELVAPAPDIAAIDVTKHREMFTVNECTAEISDVRIAGRSVQTVAVESSDLLALLDTRSMLALDGFDNVSYPRAIRGVLGGRFADF